MPRFWRSGATAGSVELTVGVHHRLKSASLGRARPGIAGAIAATSGRHNSATPTSPPASWTARTITGAYIPSDRDIGTSSVRDAWDDAVQELLHLGPVGVVAHVFDHARTCHTNPSRNGWGLRKPGPCPSGNPALQALLAAPLNETGLTDAAVQSLVAQQARESPISAAAGGRASARRGRGQPSPAVQTTGCARPERRVWKRLLTRPRLRTTGAVDAASGAAGAMTGSSAGGSGRRWTSGRSRAEPSQAPSPSTG